MLRHLRICTKTFLLLTLLLCVKVKADDYDLAKSFIEQKDCQNAIPILKAALKPHGIEKQKEILLSLSLCADETFDLKLKKKAEQLLLKIDPENTGLQLKYLETLFYMSSFREAIQFSIRKKKLQSNPEFWLSIGRTYYELSFYEHSLNALKKYLELTRTNKSEAHYWIAKNYMELEEYGKAVQEFELAVAPDQAIKSWVEQNTAELLPSARQKNKFYKGRLKLSSGYDSNILRDNHKTGDWVTLVDLYQDYYFIRKKKTQLNLGLDFSYQDYSAHHDYQYASVNLRLDYYHILTDYLSHGFSLSAGKIQADFKADQNYTFSSYYFTYAASKKFEIQPSLLYFANLNNSPIKQLSFSLSFYYFLTSDYLWISPFYRQSSSPNPEFAVAGATPYIAKYSTTSNYTQAGLILGYQKTLSENTNATLQYTYAKSKFDKYDLQAYPTATVKNPDARMDDQHVVKIAVQYRQTPTLKWIMSTSSTFNKSEGFQGFATATSSALPDLNANYEQNMTSLGVTLDWP